MPRFGRKNKYEGPTAAEQHAAELAEEVHTVDAVRRQMKPGEHLVFGGPSRCPTCGTLGFIESVNQVKGNSFNFCYSCRNRWIVSARAIEASFAYEVDTPREPAPVPAAPWNVDGSVDGFIDLQEDLAIEVTPAIEGRNARLEERLAHRARVHGEHDPTGENPLLAF